MCLIIPNNQGGLFGKTRKGNSNIMKTSYFTKFGRYKEDRKIIKKLPILHTTHPLGCV